METETTFAQRHATKIKIAAGVTVGLVAGVVLSKNSEAIVKNIQVNFFAHHNVITTELSRRGHPGYICKDLESGVVAASKNHLAAMLDVTHQTLSNMIDKGEVVILGEAA